MRNNDNSFYPHTTIPPLVANSYKWYILTWEPRIVTMKCKGDNEIGLHIFII